MEISQRLSGIGVGRRQWSSAWLRSWLSTAAPHLFVGLAVAGLAATALTLGHFTAFYSIDGDIKYLGALNIARHFPDPAIAYPSVRFDPTGRFTLPLTAWYAGHDYAGYSLPFLYIAAAALALFGTAGLILPAIAGTAILLYAQLCLADLLELKTCRPWYSGSRSPRRLSCSIRCHFGSTRGARGSCWPG